MVKEYTKNYIPLNSGTAGMTTLIELCHHRDRLNIDYTQALQTSRRLGQV